MATELQVRWKKGRLERELKEDKNVREVLHISEPIRTNLMLSSDTELSAYFVNWNRSLERRDFDSESLNEIRSEVITDHPRASLGGYVLASAAVIGTGNYAITHSSKGLAAIYILFAGFGILDTGEGKWKRHKNTLEAWNKYQERKGEF